MPRCEGLPNGPCPQNVNNRSVKLAQGDLLLCPKCEAARFPPTQTVNDFELAGRSDNASASTKAKSKPKQLSSANANGKSDVTDADDSARCDNNHRIEHTNSAAPANNAMDDQISLLRAEVHHQRDLILKLQQQLRSVLSFLGVTEQDIQLTVNDNSEQSNNISAHQVGIVDQTANQPPQTDADANIQYPQQTLEQQKPRPLVTAFQQSVIAAVYADQSEQKRRESSLIVSGLQESPTHTDKTLFMNLCSEEFNVQPDIVITKRLGRSQPTKIRPLLIVTRKTDQAQHLIAAAKQLRNSSKPTVRDNVYINRNLTRAEAEAAYRVRVQRRQAAMRRADNQQNRGIRYQGVSNSNNDQSGIDVSMLLLNTANNPNALVLPPLTSGSHVPLSGSSVSLTIAAPPAAEQLQQQGRRD